MTLVEVVVAMALVVLLCAGLYITGVKDQQFGEHNRLTTEARSLAKERLEEVVSYGVANLAKPGCTLLNADTNWSSLGYPVIRQCALVWHAANGQTAAATNAAYAEARVQVTYNSPLQKAPLTDSYSTIVAR
jgi:type II secretory pathway pseudopilin PulG